MISELPVIDLELGANLLGCSTQMAVKMIQELAASLPENLQELEKAYAAINISKLASIAHYIHGGSCYCGAPRLKAAAMALEKQAKNKNRLEDLKSVYENLRHEIQSLLDHATGLSQDKISPRK